VQGIEKEGTWHRVVSGQQARRTSGPTPSMSRPGSRTPRGAIFFVLCDFEPRYRASFSPVVGCLVNDIPVMLITGTRKGVGAHLAQYYLEKGLNVIGCSRQHSAIANSKYQHHCLDVSDEARAKALFKDIRNKYGRLDYLINNAGVGMMNHALLTPVGSVRTIFETNVFGTFLFCREAAKLMIKQRHGRIVNITSTAVPLKLEGEAAYASSKAAVITMTEVLAKELAQFSITVNAVGPGPIRTDLIQTVPEQKIDQLLARHAISRLTNFSDVANVIDFFLHRRSDLITGQTIFLGGV
jgi:3-oxoacyl-[acyl-carrier protein] reductase